MLGSSRFRTKMRSSRVSTCGFLTISKNVMSICLAITRMTVHFGLSYLEVVGLWLAYHVIPNQSYFFMVASHIILQAEPASLANHRGPRFGMLFAEIMLEEWERASVLHPRNKLWRRFNQYHEPNIPGADIWQRICLVLTRYFLYVNAAFPDQPRPPNKPTMRTAYKALIDFVIKTIDRTGTLIGNHSLLILSLVGVVPWWVRTICTVDPGAGYITHINSRIATPIIGRNGKAELARFMDSEIARLLREPVVGGMLITWRYVENLLCKVRIITSARVSHWCDTMGTTDPLVCLVEEYMLVRHPDGSQDHVPGAMMTRFGFGRALLKITEILEELRIGTDQPTDREFNRVVQDTRWNTVFYRRTMSLDLEWNLPDAPILEGQASILVDRIFRRRRLTRLRPRYGRGPAR